MSASSGLLLDLGVLTRIRGASPDPGLVQFLHRRRHQRIFISALTLCELDDGGGNGNGGGDAGPAGGWLRELAERFAANILPVDHHIALACRPAPASEPGGACVPAILAATARHHRLTVVSTEASAYAGLDVRVLDPLAEQISPSGPAAAPPPEP